MPPRTRPKTRSQSKKQQNAVVTSRNTGIWRLPAEVFSQIFLLVRDESKRYAIDGAAVIGHQWIRISQVCHLWRNIALAAPLLWSIIKIPARGSFHWAQETLSRSGNAALNVYIDLDSRFILCDSQSSARDLLLSKLAAQLARVQELTIRRSRSGFLESYLTPSRRAMPELRILRLAVDKRYLGTGHRPLACPLRLTDQIIEAPLLQQIWLDNCLVDFSSNFLGNLTHLHLRKVRFLESTSLMDTLSRTPTLQSLDFDYSCSVGLPAMPNPTEIDLPCLKYLHMGAPMEEAAVFLSNIRVLPGLMLHMYAYCEGEEKDVDHQLAEYIKITGKLPLYLDPPSDFDRWRSYRYYKHTDCEFQVQAYKEPISQDEMLVTVPVTKHKAAFDTVFSWDSLGTDAHSDEEDRQLIDSIFRRIFEASPMNTLTVVQVIGGLDITAQDWAQTFGAIPTLTSIMVGTDVVAFFQSLNYGCDSGSSFRTLQHAPFPALDSITLVELHCKPCKLARSLGAPSMQQIQKMYNVDVEVRGGSSPHQHLGDLSKETLLQTLRVRNEMELPLKRLIFIECPKIPSSTIKELGLFVDEVSQSSEKIHFHLILHTSVHSPDSNEFKEDSDSDFD